MQIELNGERRVVEGATTIAGLLAREGLAERRVAVEVNREIVPRSAHASTLVADGDRLEIVVAVGGG